MNRPQVTYTITPICDKYISRFLYTLYKYSEPGSFRVVVVDQCENGFSPEVMKYVRPMIHLYLHPIRNLGYAKAQNEALIHGLHWHTPYICLANDDIEIMDNRWIQGIWDTFALNPERIMGVTPMNPRVPGWGYGVKENPELLPYKEEYTKEDYDYLLGGDFTDKEGKFPKTFPLVMPKNSIVDGSIFIMTYIKRELFMRVGLLDERFFPGSGEDMEMMARAYKNNYRIVSTSLSWVWHHLSKSKDLFASGELERPYYKNKPYWNNIGEIWRPEDNDGHGFEPWARYTDENGVEHKMVRTNGIYAECI